MGGDPLTWLIDMLDITGLAVMSFITGPVLIQFGYMFWLRRKLDKELQEAQDKKPGEDMKITDSVDDLSALMQWAMLTPAGKVFSLAAVPVNIDDDEDVDRLWDRMK